MKDDNLFRYLLTKLQILIDSRDIDPDEDWSTVYIQQRTASYNAKIRLLVEIIDELSVDQYGINKYVSEIQLIRYGP